MKIVKLKNYGIPSYIVNIWEKHYSPYLLPVQEEAVKEYGVLDYGEGSDEEGRMQYAPTGDNDRRGSTGLPRRFAPRNDKIGAPHNDRVANQNLLVIAPTSSV